MKTNNQGYVVIAFSFIVSMIAVAGMLYLSDRVTAVQKINQKRFVEKNASVLVQGLAKEIYKAYLYGFNQFQDPADNEFFCLSSTGNQGVLVRITNETFAKAVYLCIVTPGLYTFHPLDLSQKVFLASNASEVLANIKLVNTPADKVFAVNQVRPILNKLINESVAQASESVSKIPDYAQSQKNNIALNSNAKMKYVIKSPGLQEGDVILNVTELEEKNVNCNLNYNSNETDPAKLKLVGNHHCFTFRFCPYIPPLTCKSNEYIQQTIAIPRLPVQGASTCSDELVNGITGGG